MTSGLLAAASVGQDAIKKSSKDDLPDFYNIVLERPRDDPTGYDCLFIDAASKVSVAKVAASLGATGLLRVAVGDGMTPAGGQQCSSGSWHGVEWMES